MHISIYKVTNGDQAGQKVTDQKFSGMSGLDAMTLAQEQQASAELEKDNFDLKMQIHNLQEQLRKSIQRGGSGEGSNISSGQSGRNESALKIEIQEKNMELNERNILLAKAKTAITDMKKELERIRKEHDPAIQIELEARVAKLKRSNEEIESECRLQVNTMEKELVSLKEKGFLQQEATAKADTRLEQVELNLVHAEQRLAESREDKAKLEEQWLLLQQKAGHMEEEITQARAHVELYRMEAQEAIDERDTLRGELSQARDMTHVADQLNELREELELRHTENVDRLVNAHEKELHRHKLETDKAVEEARSVLGHEKNLHEKHIQELTQRHEMDVVRAREELTKIKDELRLERQREREEAAARVDEKTNEIKTLHMQLETQRTKADHHFKDAESARVDLETCKVELSFRSDQVDSYKNENQELHTEVKSLKRSHEQAAELREGLRRTENEKENLITRFREEKENLQHKLDQSLETLENMRASFHEKESRAKLAESELTAIKASHSTVETISRDNEKIKAEVHTLTHDLLKCTHEVSDLQRDKEHLTTSLAECERKLGNQASELVHLERENASLLVSKTELNDILKADREKHSGMNTMLTELHRQSDSSIAEHKELAATYKLELEALEHRILDVEKERLMLDSRHTTMRHDYISSMQTSIENLENWDGVLTDIVEGMEIPNEMHSDRYAREQSALLETTQSITRKLSQKGFLNKGAHHSITDDDVSDYLEPAIISLTERIKIKVRRASKMRAYLSTMMGKQVSIVLGKFEISDQRAQLLTHKLNEAVASVARINAMLERDRRAATLEATESRTFREQTLVRLNENALTALERTKEEMTRELAQRDNTIVELRAEIDAYGQAEHIVKELSDRLQDLAAGRDEIAADLETSNARVAEMEQAAEAAKAYNEELSEERSNALDRCLHYENLAESLQQELNSAKTSIETLRSSQISPELAQMIRDTQNIIRSTKEEHQEVLRHESEFRRSHESYVEKSLPQSNVLSSTASSSPTSVRQQQQQHQLQSSQLPPPPTVRTPLGSMLGTHSRLSINANGNGNNNASEKGNGHNGNSSSREGGASSSSSDGQNSRSHDSNNSGRSGHGSGVRIVPTFRASQRSAAGGQGQGQYLPLQSALSPTTQTQTTFLRSAPNFSTGTPQRVVQQTSRLYTGGNTPGMSTTMGMQSTDLSASPGAALRTPVPVPSRAFSTASTPTSFTPNTQARQSVSRLHKLGSDIEALAKQLDGFDAADRNRWK